MRALALSPFAAIALSGLVSLLAVALSYCASPNQRALQRPLGKAWGMAGWLLLALALLPAWWGLGPAVAVFVWLVWAMLWLSLAPFVPLMWAPPFSRARGARAVAED